MKILICTTNNGKVKEFKHKLLTDEIKTLRDENIFIEIEENGQTFEENAFIKLNTILDKFPELKFKFNLIIAEDSGLCVDALNGEPGIYSARYCGEHGNDKSNNLKLLSALNGIIERNAHYCATIVAWFDEQKYTFVGKMEGTIAFAESGGNGFGYDPLFIPKGYHQTLGNLDEELKLKISHRSKAIDEMLKVLNNS